MREGFFGLNVALRGLYTAQRGLDVVNHNLSNASTPGYSRQVAVQQASKAMPVFDGTGMVGTGSDVVSIDRVRDDYLDLKYWSEKVSYGEWETKQSLLSDMEVTFNEPSESGFTKIMDEMFSSMQELSKDPSSTAVRALVRERGVTFTKYFNSIASHFEKLQYDVNNRIKTKVEEINTLGTEISQMNRQIYSAELDGNTANDLRDQRTLLVDKLSGLINIEASEVVTGKLAGGRDDKKFLITVSGKPLVDNYDVSKLSVIQRKSGVRLNPDEDVEGLFNVGWEDGNNLEVKGGELKGCLDIRDGNDGENGSPLYKGIPFYVKKMNEFVRTFAMAFNEGYVDTDGNKAVDDIAGHVDGYKLDSKVGDPPSGVRFFTMYGDTREPISSNDFLQQDGATIFEKYKNITAKNISISADIKANLNNISTSGEAGQKGNIKNLEALLDLRHNPHMFSEGAPEDFIKATVTTLGIDCQQAIRIRDTQEVIVKQIENRKLSDSGVSIDEEMTNLVKYQHAYNASAKMISTLQEVYETLINKTGLT